MNLDVQPSALCRTLVGDGVRVVYSATSVKYEVMTLRWSADPADAARVVPLVPSS